MRFSVNIGSNGLLSSDRIQAQLVHPYKVAPIITFRSKYFRLLFASPTKTHPPSSWSQVQLGWVMLFALMSMPILLSTSGKNITNIHTHHILNQKGQPKRTPDCCPNGEAFGDGAASTERVRVQTTLAQAEKCNDGKLVLIATLRPRSVNVLEKYKFIVQSLNRKKKNIIICVTF